MKTKITFTLILMMVSILMNGDSRPVSAESEHKRIRFQVTTVGESAGERKILSQTSIEGPPGTDFNINLQTEKFKMQTRFLSDLISDEKLKIRAKLDTRRFYGFSPANLPLYEEDVQKHTLEIGFNETIVLLPFGRGGSAETLKIEVTPAVLAVSKTEASEPLKIKFDKPLPGGEISIEAFKLPHNFEVEAVLLADGREVAKGRADCLLEEEKGIILAPVENAEKQSFMAKITVDKFSRSRPKDLIGINFSLYRENLQTMISQGAGIGMLGDDLTYRLENDSLARDKNYELKFRVYLGKGEKAE